MSDYRAVTFNSTELIWKTSIQVDLGMTCKWLENCISVWLLVLTCSFTATLICDLNPFYETLVITVASLGTVCQIS